MSQREGRISRNIMEVLRKHGYFCFKIHGSETMLAGLPDIIVCANGMFIGLETKTPEKRTNVSAVQQDVHRRIHAASGVVEVVCGPTEALEKVRRIAGPVGGPKIPQARRGPMIHD